MKKTKISLLIVLDSAGCGELPDAADYGDAGANTIRHTLEHAPVPLPNLTSLGLFNIEGLNGMSAYPPAAHPSASWGRMWELSAGKDTTTGHFEIAGEVLQSPFPTFPDGLPEQLLDALSERISSPLLGGGLPASGTEIIGRLGERHTAKGYPIVYTSADSVLQIAAHEESYGLERLYEICRAARELCVGQYNLARVIARPFTGQSGAYSRTSNRRDFSVKPSVRIFTQNLSDAGYTVSAVGKIEDIYAGVGITRSVHTKSNADGIKRTLELLDTQSEGLIFTNLVDFDMLYGHRRDPEGYAAALKEFDDALPLLLRQDTQTVITADHGCDPTYKGTDHTREYVPLLVYGNGAQDFGTLTGLSSASRIIKEYFGLE